MCMGPAVLQFDGDGVVAQQPIGASLNNESGTTQLAVAVFQARGWPNNEQGPTSF